MSGKPIPWMQAAIRAHHVVTMERTHKVQVALEELQSAQVIAARSAASLTDLVDAWTYRRRAATSDHSFEAGYLRFHGFLQQAFSHAIDARQSCSSHADAAIAELKSSHAILRTLERLAHEATAAERRATHRLEFQNAIDAWLLGRLAARPEIQTAQARRVGPAPGSSVDGMAWLVLADGAEGNDAQEEFE